MFPTSSPSRSSQDQSESDSEELPEAEYLWRCIHTKPKSEHIAAKHIRLIDHEAIQVFCPRLRYYKSTKRGKVWFVDAMFPGYIFAKFDLLRSFRAVNAAHGVTRVLRFADDYTVIPDSIVEDLRSNFDETEQITVHQTMLEGDEVEVAEGPLKGAAAVVTQILPGKDRVRILLEFLGNSREVEVPIMSLLGMRNARKEALPAQEN